MQPRHVPWIRTQTGKRCFETRRLASDELIANARLAEAMPLWEFIVDGATVFSD